jgi:outer membrane lipoprotein carrier protein
MKRKCLLMFFSLIAIAVAGWSGAADAENAQMKRKKSGTSARDTDPFVCVAGSAVSPSQGRALLERVQTYYSSIQSMQGSFHQDSYVAALDEGEASSGVMVFAKPGKMRWSYKEPRLQEVVIRDGELWMYQPDKGQVMIDSVGAVLLSALPVSFLMGIGNVTKDFDLVSACKTSAGVVVSLVPHQDAASKEKEQALEGFMLLINERKQVPQGAKIISVGGNTTAIVFENLQLNVANIPAEKFVLEYPKGVDILDRRNAPGS